MPNYIYIQADTADYDSPVDFRRADTPVFWRGSATEFRIAVFEYGILREPSDLGSITLLIKPLGPNGERPTAETPALIEKTTSDIDTYLTIEEWLGFERAHAKIALAASDTALPSGAYWLSIVGTTKTHPAQAVVLTAGYIDIEESGI